jgi:hypothetical protein
MELVGQGAAELGLGASQEQAGQNPGIGLCGNDFGIVPAPRVSRIQIEGADRATAQLDWTLRPERIWTSTKVRAISPQRRSMVASCITAGRR